MQSAQDLLLAKLALKTGLVTQDVLTDCLREQQTLSARGQPASLLQVLVRRRVVTAESLVPITQAIEATSFDCPRCHVRHPFPAVANTALACPRCRGPVAIVREDGETISERLSTGRRGTQRLSTRHDSSSRLPRDPRKSLSSEPQIKTFGPYEILSELGRGGMGVVYKARNPAANQLVALKVLLAGDMASSTQVKRFKREAELAGKLEHPAIVAIHDVGKIDDRHYFTMDFVDGTVLSDRIKARDLPLRHAVEIARDLARALNHAHERGVIHRDVKPANIIIDAAGRPHLTDFGLAREADAEDSARLTREGSAVGTPFYMSPEQARGDGSAVGPLSDVYSLGVVLFEMLTFQHPFTANGQVELIRKILADPPPRLTDIEPAIDLDVEAIVLHSIEKEPKDRYPSAEAFATDLDRYLRGEPVLVKGGVVSRRQRSKRLIAGGVAGLLSAVLGGYGVYSLYLRHVANEQAAKAAAEQEALARETAKKHDAAVKALKEAEIAFAEADRIPALGAADAFFEKLRVTVDRASECLKQDGSIAKAYLLRGRAEEISRKLDAAAQDYSRAHDLDSAGPVGLEAAYRSARLLVRAKGDIVGARESFAKLADGPGPALWKTVARAARLILQGDVPTDKILAEVEAAKRIDPGCPEVYHLAAIAYSEDTTRDRSREALDALALTLDAERKNARAYSLRAQLHLRLGESDQAEDDLRHAIALDPEDELALLVRAQVDAERGEFTQAAESVRRVLSRETGREDVPTLLYAIHIYGLANDLVSAQLAAGRIAEISPGRSDGYLALARAALGRKDVQTAMTTLLDGLGHCPKPEAQDELATLYVNVLLSSGQIERAFNFAKEHVAASPTDPRRLLQLAMLHAIRAQPGDLEHALELIDDVQSRAPDSLDAFNMRFKVLIELGRPKELEAAIANLERIAPNSAAAWSMVAKAYLATQRPSDALEAARKAIAADPANADANARLAECEFMSDLPADAAKHARAALQKDPRHARAQMILGVLSLREKGPNPEAVQFLQEALKSDPSDADAGYFLASLFYAAGKAESAVKVAESVLRLQHGQGPARLWEILGISELSLTRLDVAEKSLRHALGVDSNSARAHAALGEVLLRKGMKDDARAEIEEALKVDARCEPALRLKEQLK